MESQSGEGKKEEQRKRRRALTLLLIMVFVAGVGIVAWHFFGVTPVRAVYGAAAVVVVILVLWFGVLPHSRFGPPPEVQD